MLLFFWYLQNSVTHGHIWIIKRQKACAELKCDKNSIYIFENRCLWIFSWRQWTVHYAKRTYFNLLICKLVGRISASDKTRFHYRSNDHSVINRVCWHLFLSRGIWVSVRTPDPLRHRGSPSPCYHSHWHSDVTNSGFPAYQGPEVFGYPLTASLVDHGKYLSIIWKAIMELHGSRDFFNILALWDCESCRENFSKHGRWFEKNFH